jgi:hypothetical protein
MKMAILLTALGCSGTDNMQRPGEDLGGFSTSLPTPPMPLVSRGAPAVSSDGSDAKAANDDNYASAWSPKSLPAFLAYDLSAAPVHQALVSWYAIHAGCYIDTGSSGQRPISYTIDVNRAPGGTLPKDGWTTLLSVDQNRYCGRQHLVDLGGANWVRLNVTSGSADSPTVAIEIDVQAAPSGASDSWLFMGDSITYMTLTHAFCDLPQLVHAAKPGYFPAVLDGALGGTNTNTAMEILDDTMSDFPGRFVVLAYGTNDHANSFEMEGLVQKVIAAGKTPVVPHMPWASGSTEGAMINQQIDALYAKYSDVVKGPDLWAFFDGRTDLIPMGDVHPNSQGQEELRKQWALSMEGLDQ